MPPVPDQLRRCAPSLLTLGALVSGLSAVRFAQEGVFTGAVKCVMLAGVLDGLDGHMARFLGAVSEMGAELDSLCDLANFGVAPALVAYFWAIRMPQEACSSDSCSSEHALLWASCCLYTCCCAVRLARFNIADRAVEMDKQLFSRSPSGEPTSTVRKAWYHNVLQRKLYFQGIPAPVAAAYALAPMMLSFSSLLGTHHRESPAVPAMGRWTIAVAMAIVGLCMVSTLPTLSSKMLKTDQKDTVLRSRSVFSIVLKVSGSAAVCCAAWLHPFDLFLVLVLGHFVSLPIGVAMYYCFAGCDSSKRD